MVRPTFQQISRDIADIRKLQARTPSRRERLGVAGPRARPEAALLTPAGGQFVCRSGTSRTSPPRGPGRPGRARRRRARSRGRARRTASAASCSEVGGRLVPGHGRFDFESQFYLDLCVEIGYFSFKRCMRSAVPAGEAFASFGFGGAAAVRVMLSSSFGPIRACSPLTVSRWSAHLLDTPPDLGSEARSVAKGHFCFNFFVSQSTDEKFAFHPRHAVESSANSSQLPGAFDVAETPARISTFHISPGRVARFLPLLDTTGG